MRLLLLVGLTGAALMTEILKKRRLELAFEGHRWFDLKRRGADFAKNIFYSSTPIFTPTATISGKVSNRISCFNFI